MTYMKPAEEVEAFKQRDPRDDVARLARKILAEAEEDARAFALKAGRKPRLRVHLDARARRLAHTLLPYVRAGGGELIDLADVKYF